MEIFDPYFFSSINALWALDKLLKNSFAIGFNFAKMFAFESPPCENCWAKMFAFLRVSAMWAPMSQNAHRGVIIKNFAVLWLLLKGQSCKIHLFLCLLCMYLLWMNRYEVKKTAGSQRIKCSLRCQNVRTSWWNRNITNNILTFLSKGASGFLSWKIELTNLLTRSL